MVEGWKYGVLILAGGQGKRMGGKRKETLLLGEETFLARLEREFSYFSQCYLSVDQPGAVKESKFFPISDCRPGMGPMGGIYSALMFSNCDALLVLPCDMPLFSKELGEYLLQEHGGEGVLFLQEENGQEYPLCGIYTKACLRAMEELMTEERLCMRQVLRLTEGRKILIPEKFAKTGCLLNVNTPGTYKKLLTEEYLSLYSVTQSRGKPKDVRF